MNKKSLLILISILAAIIIVTILIFVNPFSSNSNGVVLNEKPSAKEKKEIQTESKLKKQVDKVVTEEKKEKEEKAPKSQKSSKPDIYIVKDGDTLESIAYELFGDTKYWYRIFAANESEIDDWNNIYPGQKLKIIQKN
ncbi:MAG: LysM peptidoglycan-binding domain-containing protein [Melioribacteraceae bacterium]|nr:LysM peptidoglycan-binding domain-containing protein [Melioribacteraceae bacterium]